MFTNNITFFFTVHVGHYIKIVDNMPFAECSFLLINILKIRGKHTFHKYIALLFNALSFQVII